LILKYICIISLLTLLAGCSTAQLPLSKSEPVPDTTSSLVKPPWEALVQAGPNASKDIDLETLDGPELRPSLADNQPPPLAPPPAAVPADDGAIHNVYVARVAGRDGTGTAALTEAMRRQLSDAGWPVLNSARKDALSIFGKLDVSAVHGGARTVAITWTVKMPTGKVLGVISQKNDVSAASLGDGWRETADAATGAAADGIFQLIGKIQGASP
jgi:hypothetical protein